MNTNNFNGQNGVATSAVKYNVVVRGYAEGFNTLDEVIAGVEGMMKKYPNDAIHVNGKGIRFEKIKGLDDKWSVILRDENMEMIAGFALGKIKRGLRNALAHVLGYIEVNEENEVVEENEYDVIENLVEGFNEKIENIIDGIYNETCESAVYDAKIFNDTESEYVFATMDWDIDILSIWLDHVEQWVGDEYLDVAERYYNDWENRRIYDADGICEYVGNAYGDYIEDNCCGSCLVWVKNPYYVAEDVAKNDAPCLDGYDTDRGIERVVDTIKKYLGSYIPSYLDKFGDCCICIGWDNFNEDDMKMLIEDGIFDISVRDTLYEKGIIVELSGFLVYDDGVYVSVDYDRWFNSPIKKDVLANEEIVENALESAMDDGNEYYDDKICQVGELYVSYTSPCDEFPKGCVCVVDEEGRMYGNWCNVSDSGFAVDFLVKTLEKYNKEFNRVA